MELSPEEIQTIDDIFLGKKVHTWECRVKGIHYGKEGLFVGQIHLDGFDKVPYRCNLYWGSKFTEDGIMNMDSYSVLPTAMTVNDRTWYFAELDQAKRFIRKHINTKERVKWIYSLKKRR